MTTSQWVLDNINPSIWKELREEGLRPHVREFLDTKVSRKTLLWGRRSGSTFALALRAALALASPPFDRGHVGRPRHVLYLAPQRSQVPFFHELTWKLAEAFGTLLTRNCRGDPCRLESPGARVSAFGVGGGDLAARGCDVDIILVDNAVYIKEETLLNIVHPLIYTRPDTILLVASTVSSKKENNKWLKGRCADSVVIRSSLFDIPGMTQERINQMQKEFGPEQYQTEVLARFPDEADLSLP